MNNINVWLPAIKTGSGSDIFTIRLRDGLVKNKVNAVISWFKHFNELAPKLINARIPKNTDVIVANSWNAFAFKHHSIPLVSVVHHCVHMSEFEIYKNRLQRYYHKFIIYDYEKRAFEKSDAIVAVSNFTAESYKKIFDIHKINVIHNWVNIDEFCLPTGMNHIPNSKQLAFVGNWTLRKGVDLLPDIMGQLGNDYKLICSNGLSGRRLTKKLPNNILFLEASLKTDSIVSLYQSTSLLLFPSRLEGFGYAALEAQACGRPVVATRASALPEVVANGMTGLLCNINDVDGFVIAIREILGNNNMLVEMSIAARKRAVEKFSEQIAIKKYIDLFQSLI